jgi:hypothetical protein
MRTRTRTPLPDYANCKECKQARDTRVLNEAGVCPMCLLTVIKWPENPWLPLPTYIEDQ